MGHELRIETDCRCRLKINEPLHFVIDRRETGGHRPLTVERFEEVFYLYRVRYGPLRTQSRADVHVLQQVVTDIEIALEISSKRKKRKKKTEEKDDD